MCWGKENMSRCIAKAGICCPPLFSVAVSEAPTDTWCLYWTLGSMNVTSIYILHCLNWWRSLSSSAEHYNQQLWMDSFFGWNNWEWDQCYKSMGYKSNYCISPSCFILLYSLKWAMKCFLRNSTGLPETQNPHECWISSN